MYMHNFFFQGMMPFYGGFGFASPLFALLIGGLAVWTLAWKGLALWYAARNDQRPWYIALLIINTAGILEIIYLVWFRKPQASSTTPSLFEAPASTDSSSAAKPE